MRSRVIAYGVALAVVGAALFVRVPLYSLLGDRVPFITLFPAIAFVAWYGGRGPALLALVVSSLAVAYFILEPRHSFAVGQIEYQAGLVLYILIGLGLIVMFESLQKAWLQEAEQRERLRTTLASIGDAVISSDTEGRITNMNAVAVALTGWKLEDALGQPLDTVFRIVNEETRQPVENPATRAMKEGIIAGLANHTVLIPKGGTEVPIDDSAAPIRCAKGEIVGCVLVFRDVTARRNAERVARSLAAIVESTDDAIIGKDINGVITSWNRAAERLFGYSAAEVIGRPIAVLSPPDRADEMPALLARLKQGERIEHFDTVRRAKDGRLVPISLTVSPIKDKDGRIVGASKIGRDISERKRAEEALREEKARLHATLTGIGDAVIVTDAESRLTMMNPVAQALTGWEEEAVGRPLEEVFRIINEQSRQPVESPVNKVMREGAVVGLANHTLLIAKGGTELPIDDSAAPIRDSQGHIIGCVLVFRDITARRRAEQQLADDASRHRSIVNHVIDGIIAIDENGTVEAFNPAAERLFGYRAEEVIGQNVKLLMPEPYHGEHDGYLTAYRGTGQAKIIGIGREVVGRSKDGSTFPMELAVSKFTLGGRRYFTGIVRDITERRRTEEALREADRRKNEFLAMLAHELRNPLAPIRNAIQILLMKGPPDPDLKWGREVIDRQVQHMGRLLDDLLDVSRITHNKLELRQERIELAAVVQSAVETSRPLIDSGGQELTVALPRQPVYLDADPVRLTEVFSNLLNNAAKYSEPGGHIRLIGERQGSDVVVSVTDDGMGIAAEMLPRIFDVFSQAKRVLERSQGGLGIGLSLVRGLVQLHGGSIEARSEGPGKGSEFIVRLPVVVENVVQEAAPPSKDDEQADVTKCHLLIVDDLKDSADSLAMLLRMMGHEVHTAYDGEAAIIAAEKTKPDVVLLDIGMPKLNGYDACRRIRQQAWGKGMYIIALTGWGQEDDRRRTEDAGFNHHMVKPVDPAALMKLMASLRAEQGSQLTKRI